MSDGFISDDQESFYIPNSEGEDIRFEILYEFEDDESGYSYLLLISDPEDDDQQDDTTDSSEDENEEPTEVFPLRYKTDSEEPIYEMVDSEQEWKLIEDVLRTLAQMEEEALIEDENFKRNSD